MSWNVERELLDITSKTSLDDAVVDLGVVESTARVREVAVDADWYRSGAETYSFAFSLKLDSDVTVPLLLKACVAFAPNSTAGAVLDEWTARRRVLDLNGVSTPKLFAVHRACVLEERIPYSFWEVLITDESRVRQGMLGALSRYAGVLSKAGFAAIEPYADLMSRGQDLVVVDFGEDLGPAQMREGKQGRYFTEMLDYLEDRHINCTPEERTEMFSIFERVESS